MSVFNHYQSIFRLPAGLFTAVYTLLYMFYIISTSYSIQTSTPYYI